MIMIMNGNSKVAIEIRERDLKVFNHITVQVTLNTSFKVMYAVIDVLSNHILRLYVDIEVLSCAIGVMIYGIKPNFANLFNSK